MEKGGAVMSDWIQSADGTETIREDHDAVIRRQGDEIRRLSALVDSECRRAEEAHGESQRASLEIERLRAERAWRPIETAPEDGNDFLAWGPKPGYLVVYYDDRDDRHDFPWGTLDGPFYARDAFVLWQPLPVERPFADPPESA
jgi:hypothetical protein